MYEGLKILNFFYEFDFLQIFISILLTIPVIILHHNLGSIFVKKATIYEKCAIGLAINAVIVSILASYISGITSHYFLFFYLTASFFFFFKKDYLKIKFLDVLFISIITTLLVFIYIKTLDQNNFYFNAHQSYYSGISLEILKSDYYERLKIFDNFPAVWTKYHFFNGSLESTFLFLQIKKNYFTFFLCKLSIISLFLYIFINKIKYLKCINKFYILIFLTSLIFLILPTQIKWTLASSSYTSLFFLLFSLYNFHKKNYELSLISSLIFSLTTSRSLICGIILVFLNLYQIYKVKDLKNAKAFKIIKDYKNIFFFSLIIGIGIFALVFSGDSVENHPLISLYLGNFYNENWLYLMSPAITHIDIAYNNSENFILKPKFYFYILFIIFSIIVSIKYNSNLLTLYLKKNYIYPILFLIFYILLLTFLYFINFYFRELFIATTYFLIPLILLLISSDKNSYKFNLIFYVFSVFCIFILPPGISIANYIMIEWLILFNIIIIFLKNLTLNFKFKLFTFILGILILSEFSPLKPYNIFEPNKIDTSTKRLIIDKRTIHHEKDIHCFKNDNLAALKSLKGNRVTYDKSKSKRYNVSERFIKNKYNTHILANKICTNK
jgi:hypothetical protein